MRPIKYYPKEIAFRATKYLLVLMTGAPKWHIATTYNKDYSAAVISYLNNCLNQNSSVAEIGCGTCDILRPLECSHKIGYDSDPRVLKAASILNAVLFEKIRLYQFDFTNNQSQIKWNFDVVILINWTHEVDINILKNGLITILNQINDGGIIVIDSVKSKDYKFNHNIETLFNGEDVVIDTIFSNKVRDIYSVTPVR